MCSFHLLDLLPKTRPSFAFDAQNARLLVNGQYDDNCKTILLLTSDPTRLLTADY